MTALYRRLSALVLASVVVVTMISGAPPASAVTSGLSDAHKVLDLDFDGTLADSSPDRHPIRALTPGTTITYTDGVAGRALRFDGGTAISLGTSPRLQPQDLALSFWFRPTSAMGSTEQVFSWNKTTWNTDGWYLSSEDDRTPLALSIGPAQGQPYKVSVKQPRDAFFPVDQWTNVVVGYDHTSKAVTVYRNGVAVSTTTDYPSGGSATGIIGNTSAEKSLGYNGPEYRGAHLRGDLDEWTLWNSVPSAADALDIYAEHADVDAGTFLDADLRTIPLPATLTEATVSLPARTASGADIRWSSDSSAVTITETTANVTRPVTVNGRATLTASVSLAGETRSRAFPVTLLATSAHAQLEYLADSYVLRPTIVSGSLQPELGGGATTALSTTSPGVTASERIITTTSDSPATATVVAQFTLHGAAATRSFTVQVLPEQRADYVLGYQRTPLAPDVYGPKVANSLHLAVGDRLDDYQPLNGNRGVLFAKGTPTDRVDVLAARTILAPSLFHMREGYGVIALRADAFGTKDATATDSVVLYTSPDLSQYSEGTLVHLGVGGGVNAPRAVWDAARALYLVTWVDDAGRAWTTTFGSLTDQSTRGELRVGAPTLPEELPPTTTIEGAVPTTVIAVGQDFAQALGNRFGRLTNTTAEVPAATLPHGQTLDPMSLRATLGYTDGSTAQRAVDWDPTDIAAVNAAGPGTYTISGTVRQRRHEKPFARAEADPDIYKYNGKYLFISTDDTDIITAPRMFLRQADTIEGLRTAPDSPILGTGGQTNIAGCFWAPELHEIGGRLTIFFAPCVGSARWTSVRAHVMQLQDGGDPTVQADWSAPREVRTSAGGLLQLDAAHPGISLDMTYFEDSGRHYVSWAQRYIADVNGDSELWIATIDPSDPSRLTSTPKKLVSPEYGWDLGTQSVAEGPFFLRQGNRIFLTYSGSGIDATYAVGVLETSSGQDLTQQGNWRKYNAPILSTDVAEDVYGPGHNSFTVDEDGVPLIVYHAKDAVNSYRHAFINRVHFAADGRPVLDMSRDEEVAAGNRAVTARVTVTAATTSPFGASASTRCVSGKVVVAVTVRNTSSGPLGVVMTSPHGTKTVTNLAPGKSATHVFSTRSSSITGGLVTVSSVGAGNDSTAAVTKETPYKALSCG